MGKPNNIVKVVIVTDSAASIIILENIKNREECPVLQVWLVDDNIKWLK